MNTSDDDSAPTPWDLLELRKQVGELIETVRMGQGLGFDGAATLLLRALGAEGDQIRLQDRGFPLSVVESVRDAEKLVAARWSKRLPEIPSLRGDDLHTELLLDALTVIGPREQDIRDAANRRAAEVDLRLYFRQQVKAADDAALKRRLRGEGET